MNINPPSAAFGRRGREARAPVVLPARTAKPARAIGQFVSLVGLTSLLLVVVAVVLWSFPGIEALNADTARTEQSVIKIVNQPITHLARSGQFAVFSPGWFHPGAIKPDFRNVDI